MDIRQQKNLEKQRIDKELAKIRKYFNDSKLKGYDRKKCVAKLLYVFMLGYEIEIGHIEAINLLASRKYSEKHMGYLACSLLLDEEHEMLRLITERCRVDLNSRNASWQCLSLTCIGNIGGKEQSEALIQDVKRVLLGSDAPSIVRKKAALTLLRLYRKFPELLPPDTWSNKLINLLSSRDLGVITSLMSLLLSLASDSPEAYQGCVSKAIRLLVSLVINKQYLAKYLYYGIPAPWLQIKLLRVLQFYPLPSDQAVLQNLTSVISTNIEKAQRLRTIERNKSSNRYNALHAVFFETLNLSIHYDHNEQVLIDGVNILLKYVDDREPNLRYLALDTLSRLAYSKFPRVVSGIHQRQHQLLLCLKDHDISIRRRSLDVLYSMCTKTNADRIVGELLDYLPVSDYAIREELVLKIAILAEKFALELSWYIDVVLNLIREAGDFVGNDIWYRVCQIVTNREDESLQKYCAEAVFNAVSSPAAHEVCVKVAGYVLGEFGDLIADDFSPLKQFKVLCGKFEIGNLETKQILLNTFVKMYNLYVDDNDLRTKILALFDKYRSNFDIELQQRSNEYRSLIASKDEDFLDLILDAMPVFTTRQSGVYRALFQRLKSVTDSKLRSQNLVKEEDVKAEKKELEMPDHDDDEEEGDGEEEADGEMRDVPEKEEVEEQPNLIDLGGPGPEDMLQPRMETKQPEATPQQSGGLLDFFGGGEQPKTQPAPVAQQQPPPIFETVQQTTPAKQATIFDLLGGPSGPTGASPSQAPSGGGGNILEKQKSARLAQIKQNYTKMLTMKLGQMLSTKTLEIKLKQEYRGERGRIGVYFKNLTSNIMDLGVTVKEIEEVKMDFSKVAPVGANGESPLYLKVICVSPWSGDKKPSFSINYLNEFNNVEVLEIPFPIAPHKFIAPMDLGSKEDFFKLWNSIKQDEPSHIQTTFRTKANGYNPQLIKELCKAGFNLTIYNFIGDQTSIICGGKFVSQSGNHILVCRIQVNPSKQAVRVTTRCDSGDLNTTLHEMLKEQIEVL